MNAFITRTSSPLPLTRTNLAHLSNGDLPGSAGSSYLSHTRSFRTDHLSTQRRIQTTKLLIKHSIQQLNRFKPEGAQLIQRDEKEIANATVDESTGYAIGGSFTTTTSTAAAATTSATSAGINGAGLLLSYPLQCLGPGADTAISLSASLGFDSQDITLYVFWRVYVVGEVMAEPLLAANLPAVDSYA